jgi:arylsulfatase A-like enzyme
LIQADQHRADCMNCAGHPLLKTPHLNRMAAEGAIFQRAYTAVPVCVPARTSLMCGQWSFRHGVLANWDLAETQAELDPSQETWSRLLAARGINAEYIGRWHVSSRHAPTDFGFRYFQPDSDYYSWRECQGLPPEPSKKGYFGEVDTGIRPEQSRLAWTFDRAFERLRVLADESAPFFLRVDTLEPHLPNRICEPYASMHPPSAILPWGSFSEQFEGKPFIQKQQLRTWGIEDWTWQDWAPIVGRYLGEIELLDSQIGRILQELDRLGISEDVLVIYTSDHGDMCGGHRMIDKHYVMYEDVMRIPLLARWPAQIAPKSVVDTFITATLDLPATFLDVFQEAIPESFDGLSMKPVFEDASAASREDVFAAYHGNQMGLYSQRMIFDGFWKYIWNATAEDEFYNLSEDPFELRNRVIDPTVSGPLKQMRRRMIERMELCRDPLLNQWTRAAITRS